MPLLAASRGRISDDSTIRHFGALCRTVRPIVALLILLLLPHIIHADEGRAYLALDGGFKTGDFGTAVRSNLGSLVPTFGYLSRMYELTGSTSALALVATQGGSTAWNAGLGDITLRGSRVLLPEGDGGCSIDASLALKLPTADASKGLGTGATDFGVFLGVHERIDLWKFSLSGGYIKVGDLPGIDYNDIYLVSAEVGLVLDDLYLSALYEARRALLPGETNPQEVGAGFFYLMDDAHTLRGGISLGLNKGAPDAGVWFGFARWF